MPVLPAHEQAVAASPAVVASPAVAASPAPVFLSLLVLVVAALSAVAAAADANVRVVVVPDFVSYEVVYFLVLFVVGKKFVACETAVVGIGKYSVCVVVVKMAECLIENAVVLHYDPKTVVV